MLDNQKFGKRLVQAGVINQAQLDEALRQQQVQEGRLGEILVRLGYVSESTVLQFLAAEFRTRYVSTERLAKARIPQQVLDLLPLSIAEHFHLIPVLYDPENSTLSIVTSDPQNDGSLREVHMITRVRELRVYVALQSAVQAAIRKHYRGDVNAFAPLLHGQYYEGAEPHSSQSPDYPIQYTDAMSSYPGHSPHESAYSPSAFFSTGTPAPIAHPSPAYPMPPYEPYNPVDVGHAPPAYAPPPPPYHADPYGDNDDDVTRIHSNFHEALYDDPPPYTAPAAPPPPMPAQAHLPPEPAYASAPATNLLALSRLFIQKIQRESAIYRRHLGLQEPLLRLAIKRLNMNKEEAEALWLAFYIHHIHTELPKADLISLEQQPALQAQIRENHEEHLHELAGVALPTEVFEILQHAYERYDGRGFPNQLNGQQIPVGSRLLAILDAYECLRSEKEIKGDELIKALKAHERTLFDPDLLSLICREIQRIQDFEKGVIPSVLLLDPDRDFTQQLERSLLEKGWWVQAFDDPDEAEAVISKHRPDLVVLEIDISHKTDGFGFIEHIRKNYNNPPEFLLLTSPKNDDKIERGMSVAQDFMTKSSNASILVARINRVMAQLQEQKKKKAQSSGKKGLTGSLEQLGLPDLLQVLSQGRRTGRLAISHPGEEMGYIFLEDGYVFHATCGELKAEHAFYRMIGWEKGEFSLDPAIKSETRTINKSLDGLILDGLRMLDEARRDGDDEISFSGADGFEEEGEHHQGGSESDFFDLAFEEGSAAPASQDVAAPAKAPEAQGAPMQGLFQDLQEGDLEDAFSSTFVGDNESKKTQTR